MWLVFSRLVFDSATVANFQLLNCCLDIQVFQTYAVEEMDEKSFSQHLKLILAMIHLGRSSSKVTARFPGGLQGSLTICWRRGLIAFQHIYEQVLKSKGSATGRQLMETPYRLAQSKLSLPPMVIDEIDLSGNQRQKFVSIFYSSFGVF
jgi:hypothetical protein